MNKKHIILNNSFWNWATAAGYDERGRLLAFNLCRNMIAADEVFKENCFWIDGKICYLPAASFEFGEIMDPWKVNTAGENLNLSFLPKGQRAQKINIAGLISRSDYITAYLKTNKAIFTLSKTSSVWPNITLPDTRTKIINTSHFVMKINIPLKSS